MAVASLNSIASECAEQLMQCFMLYIKSGQQITGASKAMCTSCLKSITLHSSLHRLNISLKLKA